MKKIIVLFLLLGLLAACSLDSDDGSNVQSGPRLLNADGKTVLLSDPGANDLAPHIVTVMGMLDVPPYTGYTNRYIYFVSDRPYNGSNISGVMTNKVKQYAIFRAREVKPQLFTDLQIVFEHDQIFGFYPISNPDDKNSGPSLLVMHEGGLYGYQYPYASSTFISSSHQVLGGFQLDQYNHQVFVTAEYEYPTSQMYTSLNADSVEHYITSYNPNDGNLLRLDMSALFHRVLKVKDNIMGCAPIRFLGAGAQQFMGMLLSHNGVFHVAINTVPGLGQASNTNQQSYLLQPFPAIEHVPGTKDVNPSFDPLSGLYFSSDRGGKFDLYYVPLHALVFEGHYSPQIIAPPVGGGI